MDGANEFHDEEMKQLAREFQLNLEKPAPYIHEKSGKIERSHRTNLGIARAMMKTACLPDMFWNLVICHRVVQNE